MNIQHEETGEIVEGVYLLHNIEERRLWKHVGTNRNTFFHEQSGWSEVKEPRWVDVTGDVRLGGFPGRATHFHHHETHDIDQESNYRFRKVACGEVRPYSWVIIVEKQET